MQWTTMPVRLPEEVLTQLETLLELTNQGQAVPLTLNEFVVEVLRSHCTTQQNRLQNESDAESASGPAPSLTLHAAIEQVLRDHGCSMKFADIRDEVIRRNLYREGDGNPPSHQQVRARVQNYPRLFRIDRSKDPQEVSLVEWEQPPEHR